MRDLRAQFYDQAKADYFKALYCGKSKAGKTFLMGTYPNPFIIDTDGGGRTLKGKHIPFVSYSIASLRETDVKKRPKPYEEIRYIIGKLILNKCKLWIEENPACDEEGEQLPPLLWFEGPRDGYYCYTVETFGIDSATMLSELLLYEVGFDPNIGETKNVAGKRDLSSDNASFAEYRSLKNRIGEIFDMTKDLKANIVATAGIDGKQNEQGEWILSQDPDIQGTFRKYAAHYFDTVALLERDPTNPDKHWMRTHTNKFGVGTRDKLPPQIENPTYEKIMAEMKKLEEKK